MDISALPLTTRATTPTPPAHSEIASTLATLSREGAHFTVDGVDVPPDAFATAAQAAQTPCRVVMPPDQVALPVAGIDDLVALTTLHGAGAPAAAATAHLVGALRTLRQAGSVFKALDRERLDARQRPSHTPVDIGAYGALKALSGETRFSELVIEAPGQKPLTPINAEEVAAQAFFKSGGRADDLALPVVGRTLQALDQSKMSLWISNDYNARPVTARDAYLAVHAATTDRVWIGRADRKLMEIPVQRLQTDPSVATEVLDRVERFDRLNAARRDASVAERALRLLDEPVGHTTMAEREAAMIEILTLRRGWSGGEEREYRAVMGAIRDGEKPVDTARDFGRFITAFGGRDRADDVTNGWPYYRALPPDAATRYLGLVSRAQSHASARTAYDTLYADSRTDQFPVREKSLDSLIAIEGRIQAQRGSLESGKVFAGAADVLALIATTVRPDETLEEATSRYATLEGRVWSGDEAHEAFRFVRQSLLSPSSMPAREREAHFISLLDARRNVEQVREAWTLLTVDDRREGFEARKAQLDRLVARRPTFEQALADLQKLHDATASQGGLESPAATRLFRFVEVSSNFEEAKAAIDLVEHAALPTDAGVREQMYLSLADARQRAEAGQNRRDRATGADVKDDYWHVVRAAGTADPVSVAEQYGRLLKAAHGDTDEARVALSVVRQRLSSPIPPGADLTRREAWLTRFLDRCGKTSDACAAVRFIESASSVQDAERRADALDGVVKMAIHFRSADAVTDAVAILNDLQARAGGVDRADEAIALLTRLADRVPSPVSADRQTPLDRVRAQLVPPGVDLDTLVTDLRGVHLALDRVSRPWDIVEIWPLVSRLPAAVSHAERAEALGTLLAAQKASRDDVVRLYETACEGADAGAALKANVGLLSRMLTARSPFDTIECFHAIQGALQRFALVGEPADLSRAARYAGMVADGAAKYDLAQIFDTLLVPVGAEPLAEREAALATLWNAERTADVKEVATEAVRDFEAIAATQYPGDSLSDTAQLFVELMRAVHQPETARVVMGRLQTARLTGEFPDSTTRQLVERFLEAYVVNPDIDAAMAALHRTEKDPGTVVNGPDEVVIGGIKLPKRRE